jgi:hypothetical protein
MATPFTFTDNSTTFRATNMNQVIERNDVNLLRNSAFESWLGGTSVAPDGWSLAGGGGGSIARATGTVASGRYGAGEYCAHVTKLSGDAGTDRLEQDLSYIYGQHVANEWFCLSALCHNPDSSTASRLYMYDGTQYFYSSYMTGSWAVVSVCGQFDAAADELKAGVECARGGSTYNTYVNDIMLVRGQVAPKYTMNPADQAMLGYYYDNDGTFTMGMGGMRIVPWIKTGTFGGGSPTEIETITLVHGCSAILFAHGEPYLINAADPNGDILAKCHSYTTTSFQCEVCDTGGTNLPNQAYELRGFAILAGWDNAAEVFGA